jgi:hypothetical protein
MATTTRKKTPCSKCEKAAGVFTCRGCEKDFCYRHVAEHRQELNKNMDDVATHHDQLQQAIAEQEAQPNSHPLMKKIDSWEQQSVDKIHQAANNARKELLTILGTNRTMVTNKLTPITQELSTARNEDDYVETDLKEWVERLNALKKDLTAAQTIDFNPGNNGNALISKIFINGVLTDYFERIVGSIQIIEDGRVAVHGQTNQNAAVCGRCEYSSGQHQFRFNVQQSSGHGYFSCGIVSKSAPMESLLLNSSSYNNMHDGYYNNSRFFSARNDQNLSYFTDHYRSTQTNDMIELVIDCDRRIMRLTNERTCQTQDLNVNLNTCPFPWQFFVTLSNANDRVRLYEEKPITPNKRRNLL